MIGWIFTALALIALITTTIIKFEGDPSLRLVIFSSIYLIGKGVILKDFMSIVDLVWGIYLLFAFIFGISSFIYYIIFAWFMYKLIFMIIFSFGN